MRIGRHQRLRAIDAAGNVYVVEWITGGRITKLVPVK